MQPGVAAGLRLGFLRSPPLPSTIASLNPLKELTEKLSSARAVLLPAQIRPVYPMGRRRGIDVTEDKRGAWGVNRAFQSESHCFYWDNGWLRPHGRLIVWGRRLRWFQNSWEKQSRCSTAQPAKLHRQWTATPRLDGVGVLGQRKGLGLRPRTLQGARLLLGTRGELRLRPLARPKRYL